MSYQIRPINVWAVDVRNRPGMLARVLEALSNAGAELDLLVARRVTENTSRVFAAPISGPAQSRAAADVGMNPASGMYAISVEGPDRAGLGAGLTRAFAAAGLNLRGVSAARIGPRCAIYLGFESAADAKAGARIAGRFLRNGGRGPSAPGAAARPKRARPMKSKPPKRKSAKSARPRR